MTHATRALPNQIGITGGIGSGKSLVCEIFRKLGVSVYDADRRAKELMTTDKGLIKSISEIFGEESYDREGRIDRSYIAAKVFGKPTELEKLNNLVHPVVKVDYEKWVSEHATEPYVIKEAALIFEAGSWKDLNMVVVVSAPEEVRLKRVLERDKHRTRQDVLNIFRSQLSESETLSRADAIIVNDDTRMVIPQVLELHRKLAEGIKQPS